MKKNKDVCLEVDPNKKNYLLIGDSTAAMMYYGLKETFPEINFLQATASACPPVIDLAEGSVKNGACGPLFLYIYNEFLHENDSIDKVIIVARGLVHTQRKEKWKNTITHLTQSGYDVVVVLRGVHYNRPFPSLIYEYGSLHGLGKWVAQNRSLEYTLNENASIKETLKGQRVSYISPLDLMCPDDDCALFYDGVPVIRDRHHLTSAGSLYFAEQIKEHVPEFAE